MKKRYPRKDTIPAINVPPRVPPLEVRPAYRSDGALEVRVSIGGGWSARGTVRPVTDEDRARMTGSEPVDLSGFLTDSDPGDETR